MKLDIEVDASKHRLFFTGFGEGLVVHPWEGEAVDFSLGPQSVPLSRIIDNQYGSADASSPWFAFWQEDCAFPPIYLVRAETWEAAYEDFCDEVLEPLSADDMTDYDEDEVARNSSGEPIDTESVQGCAVRLESAQLVPPAPLVAVSRPPTEES